MPNSDPQDGFFTCLSRLARTFPTRTLKKGKYDGYAQNLNGKPKWKACHAILTLYLLVLSADNLRKQFGHNVRPHLDPNCDTLGSISIKLILKKNQQTSKITENYPVGKEVYMTQQSTHINMLF